MKEMSGGKKTNPNATAGKVGKSGSAQLSTLPKKPVNKSKKSPTRSQGS
jgi:hypothetical protein